MRLDPDTIRRLDRGWNCRLTVTGRKSGKPRSVTIWYVLDDGKLFLTGSEEMPQWCRNLRANPGVTAVVRGTELRGSARIVEDPEAAEAIRQRFLRKYLLARLARPFGGYTRSTAVEVRLQGLDEVEDLES